MQSLVLRSFLSVALLMLATTSDGLNAQKEEIGYNDLVAEIGGGLESGVNIKVAQVEANTGNPNNGQFFYLPNSANAQFAGKTITDGSGFGNGTSNHATVTVGQFFYGNTSSIAPGITDITGFEAGDWLQRILGSPAFGGPNTDPIIEDFRVSNHSWVARNSSGISVADSENMLQRLDYYVNQTETTVVVGADNQAALPRLLTQGYNSISVGRSSGNHSFGLSDLYINGRTKPDIVAPANTTSRATAIVSSAAALLHEKADNMGSFDARRSEVVKAIIMAGATKEEFGSWDRTTTRPLDEQFGAGELNIYNSYFIMDGGEFDGTSGAPAASVDLLGWDYGETLAGGDSLFYEFEVEAEAVDLSFLLAWNMEVTDTDPTGSFTPSFRLANLQLELFDSSDMVNPLDSSLSAVDNVEHIYLNSLAQGFYTFKVSNASAFATDFGLAWRITAVPEPTSSVLVLALLGGICSASRRRRTCRK